MERMKILICHKVGGAFGFITDSWISALQSFGHDARRWDGQLASWKAFDPDVYIGCSGHRQPIPAKRRAKVAIHVNPYGPIDMGPINEPQNAITWTIAQRPDAVFGYGHTHDAHFWSYWTEKHGIPWVPMATAGDLCAFHPREVGNKQYDFVYVGGCWGYKAKNIGPYLYPLLRSKLKHAVRGWGDWPAEFNVKPAEDAEVPALFRAAKVAPCICEPHTYEFGIDVPERMFKTILSGAVAVHDAAPAVTKLVKSAVVAGNPAQYEELVRHYATNDADRLEVQAAQFKEVLDGHTYHHRMIGLLSGLGLDVTAMRAALPDIIASYTR